MIFVISNIDLPEEPWGGSPDMSTGIEGGGAPREGGSAFGRPIGLVVYRQTADPDGTGNLFSRFSGSRFLGLGGAPVIIRGLVAQSLLRQSFWPGRPRHHCRTRCVFSPLSPACSLVLWRSCPESCPGKKAARSVQQRLSAEPQPLSGGDARQDLPVRHALTDRFGTTHYVLVEPGRSRSGTGQWHPGPCWSARSRSIQRHPQSNAALADNDH